ncbi:MAG: hypothetical protein GC165_01850 [Armatimonadetes bacterium]|nr:hypothetical protein [Armatimonadota bacterium]
MKYRLISRFAVGLAVALPTVAMAQYYQNSSDFFGIGTGVRGRGAAYYGKRMNSLGVQIGVYNDIDLDPNSLSDGPPPNDTQFLGNYRTSPGFGTDLLFFPGNERQSLFFGVGLYYEDITEVGRSASSGFLYEFGHHNAWRTGLSVGLQASVSNTSNFSMGYHNLLGWNISFSMRQ